MSRARDIANYGDGIDTASITSGTFADARIAQSNVTQHESAIDALGTVASGTFNGTIGDSATFPTNHPLQIKSFNTNTDIIVASTAATGTARILNDGSNNVAVTLTTSKANSSFMLIFGASAGMEIDGAGDFYGSASVGYICNQAITEGGLSITANTQTSQSELNAWVDGGTTVAINYGSYRSLNTNDRIVPFFNPTYIKHITTSLSSGTSVTFSMTGGLYNNSEVKVRRAYITAIEF